MQNHCIINPSRLSRGAKVRKFLKFLLTLFIILAIIIFVGRYIYKTEYIDIIEEECLKYNVDTVEILSIIKAESNFKEDAVSSKNAYGLMQITHDTANWCAKELGLEYLNQDDLLNPYTNIKLGVFYYSYLLKRYNDTNSAFAAYNGGMGNVDKWLKDQQYSKDGKTIHNTPFAETTRYITKINNNIKIYRLLYKEL